MMLGIHGLLSTKWFAVQRALGHQMHACCWRTMHSATNYSTYLPTSWFHGEDVHSSLQIFL